MFCNLCELHVITLGQSLSSQHKGRSNTKEEADKSCSPLKITRKNMKLSRVRSGFYAWFPWRESFVMVPMMSMVFNAILAATLSQITSSDNPELLNQGIVMIGLVSNASISIVTLTFSLTVLSIQIAAQSYSPRLLDDFLKVRTKEENLLVGLIAQFDDPAVFSPHLNFVVAQRFFRIQ
jgi:hypothetical protein